MSPPRRRSFRASRLTAADLPPAMPSKLSTLRSASQIVLLWLMSFDARQQFFFQRSPELREPLNFRLAPIEVLDKLGAPLNLHLETIKQINNLAVLVAERVETWVCRHHPAHSLFILGEP